MENDISWVIVFGSSNRIGQLGSETNMKVPHVNKKKTYVEKSALVTKRTKKRTEALLRQMQGIFIIQKGLCICL